MHQHHITEIESILQQKEALYKRLVDIERRVFGGEENQVYEFQKLYRIHEILEERMYAIAVHCNSITDNYSVNRAFIETRQSRFSEFLRNHKVLFANILSQISSKSRS